MNKKLLIISIIIIILLTGCQQSSKSIIQTEKIISNTNMDDLAIRLSYNKQKSQQTKTYLLRNGEIEEYNDTFFSACSDDVPSEAINRISQKLGFENSFLEINEALIYYSNQLDYELFLVETIDRLEWKIYILYKDDFKEVTIKHKEEMIIQGYQVENDYIYVFSKKIYKINLLDYKAELVLDAGEIFETDGTGDIVFINNDMLVNGVNPRVKIAERKYIGIYRIYNFKNGEIKSIKEIDRINQVFPYKDGYIALCSKKDTWEPVVKYYNGNFELIREEEIKINSDFGNVVLGYHKNISYLYNNYIYTLMSVDASHVREIVILDADSAKVLYQEEITYYDRDGYFLSGADFYKLIDDKLINLKEF